jgi:hypothetical protein
MSKAPAGVVEQAQRLAASARMLPVDDAAKALEQAITVLQAAQAQVLVDGERSGDLAHLDAMLDPVVAPDSRPP